VKVENGHIIMPELPGIGFEGKSERIELVQGARTSASVTSAALCFVARHVATITSGIPSMIRS
jgi:hypothetical protein